VNTFASTFNIDWNKDLKATPTNFKVGKCTGECLGALFCASFMLLWAMAKRPPPSSGSHT
jgi:hypothetical protein